MVWTMLFSRIVDPPSFLRTEIASTAIGIDALTVRPARSPRYTVDAPNSNPNSDPMMTAFSVNSAGDSVAGTYGLNARVDGDGGAETVLAMPRILANLLCYNRLQLVKTSNKAPKSRQSEQ